MLLQIVEQRAQVFVDLGVEIKPADGPPPRLHVLERGVEVRGQLLQLFRRAVQRGCTRVVRLLERGTVSSC